MIILTNSSADIDSEEEEAVLYSAIATCCYMLNETRRVYRRKMRE